MECGLQIPDPLPMNLIYTMVRVPTVQIIKYLLGTTSTFRTRSDFCCYKFQILLVFGGAFHYNSHISATLHINRTFGTSWQLAFESLRACRRCSVPQQVCFSNGSIEAQSIEEQSQRGI